MEVFISYLRNSIFINDSMSIKHKLISNTTYLFFDWFFISIISFLFQIVIVKTLSVPSYGAVAIIIQISILLASFCLFGLDIATRKLISEFLKTKKKYNIGSVIRFSIKIIFSISLIVVLLIILFNQQLSAIFNLDYRIFILISFMTVIIVFYTYFGSVYQGYQNMKKYFFTDLYGQIFKFILFYPLILIGFDYFGPVIAILIGYLVALITRIDINFLKNISNKFQLNRLVLRYAFPAFIVSMLSTLLNYTQYIILTLFSVFKITTLQTLENIGVFALSMTISTPILVASNLLAAALFPITSELSAEKNSKCRQAYLIKLVLRYIFFQTKTSMQTFSQYLPYVY